MAEEFAHKIKRLELENFTCFGKVALDFSPGINVFIGENGTGKTHLLKALLMGTNKEFKAKFPHTANEHTAYPKLTAALLRSYYPPSIRPVHLIRKGTDKKESAIVKVQVGKLITQYVIDAVPGNVESYDFGFKHDAVFIPSQEMISWFEGFSDLYENYVNAFDPTYYHLSKSLSRPIPKGKQAEKAKQLISEIENTLHIQVVFDGQRFFINQNNLTGNEINGFQAPLVATGINKLAQLIQLTMNGAIYPGSIIIWDEPESGLNPKYINTVAQFLLTLANAGCQIFVATHDYLLPYHLSLSIEYAEVMKKMKKPVPPMKFFSLYKGEDGTKVEEGDDMPSIHHDAIMEGHSYYNEFEKELFRKSVNQGA